MCELDIVPDIGTIEINILGVCEIGVYGKIFKHSIIESFFPFGYILFDNILDMDIKLLNFQTHILFSIIIELINNESNIFAPPITSYRELIACLKIQTNVVIIISPILVFGELYYCMRKLEESLMKSYEKINLLRCFFVLHNIFQIIQILLFLEKNKNTNIVSGFKLKTLYNL